MSNETAEIGANDEPLDLRGWRSVGIQDRPLIDHAELTCMRSVKRRDGSWDDACLGRIVLHCKSESEVNPEGQFLGSWKYWAECDRCGTEYIFEEGDIVLRPLIKKHRSRLLPQTVEED